VAIYFDGFADSELKQLGNLASLRELSIMSCEEVTDEGLKHIAKLSTLEKLNISYLENVTDIGLEHLTRLANLKSLELPGTSVTKKASPRSGKS
jgi:F-box and leucine-rich repeat protein 14